MHKKKKEKGVRNRESNEIEWGPYKSSREERSPNCDGRVPSTLFPGISLEHKNSTIAIITKNIQSNKQKRPENINKTK